MSKAAIGGLKDNRLKGKKGWYFWQDILVFVKNVFVFEITELLYIKKNICFQYTMRLQEAEKLTDLGLAAISVYGFYNNCDTSTATVHSV